MRLSDRLNAVIGLVSDTVCGADVGCDHGFISIELISRKVAQHMIAMDVREGPLSRAKEHIEQFGLTDKIETRLSDGVSNLKVNEADAVIVAGMGGNLVIHILESGQDIIKNMKQCVLQPQSEIEKVRAYLRENKYKTVAEEMIYEDGKYYPMMKVVPDIGSNCEVPKVYDCYGELLIKEKNPVLKKYLLHQLNKKEEILKNLSLIENTYCDRISEIKQEKQIIVEALDLMC